MKRCPRCGNSARILLNLAGCISPSCRNYEAKWAAEWQNKNTKKYKHHDPSHSFLGSYTSEGLQFDLYHYININGQGVCFARYGNTRHDCYYVDDKQTEIGCLATGTVKTLDLGVQNALKESLRRSPKNP